MNKKIHSSRRLFSMRFSTKLHCFDSALKLEQTEFFRVLQLASIELGLENDRTIFQE